MTPHSAKTRSRTARLPESVPARFRSAPPEQKRSRETMNRFVEATEQLLRTRNFEDISIQDIVGRSGRPIGSFYARFGSKEALLPLLYRRYHDRLEKTFRTQLEQVPWDGLDLSTTILRMVDFLLGLYDKDRGLIRAVALFARTHPDGLPADIVPHRRRIYDRPVRILARHRQEIPHPDPEAAIRFGIFMVSSVAREKILFVAAPHSRITPMNRQNLRRELTRALHSYLTGGVPG